MIKIISFDIGGTILYSKNLNEYNLKELTKLLNKPYDDVRKYYKEIFQKQKGSLLELVTKFCNSLDVSLNNKILNFFEEKFKDDNNIGVIDENINLLFEELKEMGYKIILLSNSCCLIKNKFNEDFLKSIDDIFYSYDIGYTKEQEGIYKYVEEKMKCQSEEFLHIGDTLSSDYLMPKKFGWNALYYGKTEDYSVETIERLEDIIEILQGELWKRKKYF